MQGATAPSLLAIQSNAVSVNWSSDQRQLPIVKSGLFARAPERSLVAGALCARGLPNGSDSQWQAAASWEAVASRGKWRVIEVPVPR